MSNDSFLYDFWDQTLEGYGQRTLKTTHLTTPTSNSTLWDLGDGKAPLFTTDRANPAPDFYWNPAWDPVIYTKRSEPDSKDEALREIMREFSAKLSQRNVTLTPKAARRRDVVDDLPISIVQPQHVDSAMVLHIVKKRNAGEPGKYILLDSYSDFRLRD